MIAYEKPENHEGQGMNVLFGDGTVQWIGSAMYAQVAKELQAGQNPPPTLFPATQPTGK